MSSDWWTTSTSDLCLSTTGHVLEAFDRETTAVWPLVFPSAFFSLFIFPSSSWLPQSLVGLPSCHIVLERFLNTVLSSCHPVFSPTIHPSIPPFFPPPWSLHLSPGGFLDCQRCVFVCICVCVRRDSNKCQVGIHRWAVMEPLKLLSGLSGSTPRLPFPLCAFFVLRTWLTLTDANMNGQRWSGAQNLWPAFWQTLCPHVYCVGVCVWCMRVWWMGQCQAAFPQWPWINLLIC